MLASSGTILVTAVQRPPRVHAAIVVEAGGRDHEGALLREMVVVEIESGGLVRTWIGLEAEGIPSSSGGWETTSGWSVYRDEDWRRLDGREGCGVGESSC